MDVRDLIAFADIKEQRALALISLYHGKLPNKDLQEMVNNYCNNMVDIFIENYKDALNDEKIRWQFTSHMLVISADKPNSGRIFYETLYKKMTNKENNSECETGEPNK